MPRDYAKPRKRAAGKAKTNTRRSKVSNPPSRGWQWYSAGLISGVFLSFLLYLGTLPSGAPGLGTGGGSSTVEAEPPKPRFDFYTLLPEQTMGVEPDEQDVAVVHTANSTPSGFYLLQAGAFKQREDAETRRGQLLLLNLEPKIEESNGDNGRLYRVYLGPFHSKSKLNKARSLTAAESIDTLLLKRGNI